MASTPPPVGYLRDRRESLVASTLALLAVDTQNPPGRTRDLVDHLDEQFADLGLATDTVHAVDEYTTVDALVGNALTYARVPDAYADRLDE